MTRVVGAALAYEARRLGAVQERHAVVHEHDVGLRLERRAHGVASVLGEADHAHVGLRRDEVTQAFGHHAVIVRDEHA